MKKALRFSAAVCLVSWLAFLAYWFITGGHPADNPIWFTVFGSLYMLLPMCTALVMQRIAKEKPSGTGLLHFKINMTWAVALALPIIITILTLCVSTLLPGVSFGYDVEFLLSKAGADAGTAETLIGQLTAIPPVAMAAITIIEGIFAGCTVNALFAFGEEYGWRNYMASALEGRGFWKSAAVIGTVWGIWHFPMILWCGHNYPDHPVAGMFMMVGFCLLLGIIGLYLVKKSGSVYPAAIFHGSINSVAGLCPMMLPGGSDILTGLTGATGFAVIALVIAAIVFYDRKISGDGITAPVRTGTIQKQR